MKPTPDNGDKGAVRWSLSWQSDDRSASFTKGAILACAPPTSGVYGLFNSNCQVFIGESANMREALLLHESETDFQYEHLRPTGFTFEPCPAELRTTKVDELIARFRPVLQTQAAFAGTFRSLSKDPMASEVGPGGQGSETYADQEFPVHEREKRPKVRRRFQFKRTQAMALAAILVASAAVIFYLGLPADYAIHQRANGANPTSHQTEIGQRPPNAPSIDTARRLTNQGTEPTPAKPDVHASASATNAPLRFAAESTPAADRAGVEAKTSSMARSPKNANLSKKWSVQISAVPGKNVADTLAQRLKANGYDGYVVQANVKGQTYYRVRVGQFDSREKAESVRQSLSRQDGYRDAYLTDD